jgi:hypothetical protein
LQPGLHRSAVCRKFIQAAQLHANSGERAPKQQRKMSARAHRPLAIRQLAGIFACCFVDV